MGILRAGTIEFPLIMQVVAKNGNCQNFSRKSAPSASQRFYTPFKIIKATPLFQRVLYLLSKSNCLKKTQRETTSAISLL
jgi:hypothetical protein